MTEAEMKEIEMREAFEAWAAKPTRSYRLERMPVSDQYGWNSTACAWEAFQAGAASVPTAEPVEQWVSVEERLPEKNTEVLIFFRGRTLPATGQYTGSPHDNEGWCYPCENVDNSDSPPIVTHWQPLPAPPATEAGKGESS